MKTWEDEIKTHIASWQCYPRINAWVKNVYHFTDVNNAVSIIRSGEILCRKLAKNEKRMVNDNASSSVLTNTQPKAKDFVRFYYAPLTPTQYRNEGIQPLADREDGHCPMPVFFAFDAYDMMTRDDAYFSDGNMCYANTHYGPELNDFLAINFENVFHRSWLSPEDRDEIVRARNAEFLIPERLDIKTAKLSWIGCRSIAERQTLLSLLGDEVGQSISNLIRIPTSDFFERDRIFIEAVNYWDGIFAVSFNSFTKYKSPVIFSVKIFEKNREIVNANWTTRCVEPFYFKVNHITSEVVTVVIYIENCLAFHGNLYVTREQLV